MKIVVCPDSFKGCLDAQDVTGVISEVLKEKFPESFIIRIPLADGGEGTSKLICDKKYPLEIHVSAHDPLGRLINTCFNLSSDKKKAFIESAKIIGLPLLKIEERNPIIASSFGLGEMINHALEAGCQEISISLGGSATCDAGEGMLKAIRHDFSHVRFNAVCDVTNPLLGENGCVNVFAPQKGAKLGDLPILEAKIKKFFENAVKKGVCDNDSFKRPGSGAAGGIGFTLQMFLKANYINGIDFVLKTIDFKNRIKGADYIITGEGKIDRQSLMGKVLSGVLKEASEYNIPVIAVGGIVEDESFILKAGVSKIINLFNPDLSLQENMKPEITKENIRKNMFKNINFQHSYS